LTIEVAEGVSETIMIYEGDDPDTLANEFAERHGLDD